MKTKSLSTNFFYNTLLTLLNLLFPLITAPYVSRILGAENLGKVNFSMAFTSWFIVLAMYGTATYGIREIAKVKDNRIELGKVYSELLLLKIVASFTLLIIFSGIVFTGKKYEAERILYTIMCVNILLNVFSLDWFFQGIEEYRYITIRSIVFKILSIAAMFLLVKNRDDYAIYAGILVFATGFGNIYNYIYSKKFAEINFRNINLKRHMSSLNIFFLSSLVVSCYTILDQVFTGFLSNNKAVAYLVRAKQITGIGMAITNSLATVIMPRASYYFHNDKEEYRALLKTSLNFIYLISIPCVVGIISLSREIMILMGGTEFLEGANLASLISINILIVSIGIWNYNQIILPSGNEKFGLKVQTSMAIISLVLNIILIPKLGFIGAGISLVATELTGTALGLIKAKKIEKINLINKSLIKILLASIVMYLFLFLLKKIILNIFSVLILSVVFGFCIYVIILFIVREEETTKYIVYFLRKLGVNNKIDLD